MLRDNERLLWGPRWLLLSQHLLNTEIPQTSGGVPVCAGECTASW